MSVKKGKRTNTYEGPSEQTLRRYDITKEEYSMLFNQQQGLCAICKLSPDRYNDMCVDHDHESGVVRGLLCTKCNVGLGMFCTQPVILRRAAEYLERLNPVLLT